MVIERTGLSHSKASPTLKKMVEATLEQNRITVIHQTESYTFHQPSGKSYRNIQWLWDSCFHAMTMAYIDRELALSELLALLAHQEQSGKDAGMIPHMRFWEGAETRLEFHHRESSWLSNPPLIASSIVEVGKSINPQRRKALYRTTYHKLSRFHQWLDQRRDLFGDGLVVNIHPWETGRDAAMAWDGLLPSLSSLNPAVDEIFKSNGNSPEQFISNLASKTRIEMKDDLHIGRLLLNELVALVDCDAKALLKLDCFCVQAADYNAMRVADMDAMSVIAEGLGYLNESQIWSKKAQKSREAVRALLWDEELKTFRDAQIAADGSRKFLGKFESSAAFVTFFGSVPSERQTKMLLSNLLDEKKFWTSFPLPSEPANSGEFEPGKYWRGNIWPSIQWLVIQGLALSPHSDIGIKNTMLEAATQMAKSLTEVVQRSGTYEYFNPITGEGLGDMHQSWAGLALNCSLAFSEP
jgi:glycogen debranching enzyme